MYDRKLVLTILGQIYQVSQTILKRFEPVQTVSDFTDSPGAWKNLTVSVCC